MTRWRNFLYSSDGAPDEGNYLVKIKKLLKTKDQVNIDLAFQLLRALEQPTYITLHRLLKATNLSKTMGLYFEQGVFRFLPFKDNSLSLANCDIQCFPSGFSQISYLQHLYLSFNPLGELPENIDEMNLLQTLDLTHTLLTQLPPAIVQLKHLTSLFLHGTQIEDLSLLADMPQLRYLSLTQSQALKLTPEILKHWTQLEHVYLYDAYNQVPETISNLPCVHRQEGFFIRDEINEQCFLKFDVDKKEFFIQIGYWGNRAVTVLEWAAYERWLGTYAANPLEETYIRVHYYYQDNVGGWQVLIRLLDTIETSSKVKIFWTYDQANTGGWELMEMQEVIEILMEDYAISIETQ